MDCLCCANELLAASSVQASSAANSESESANPRQQSARFSYNVGIWVASNVDESEARKEEMVSLDTGNAAAHFPVQPPPYGLHYTSISIMIPTVASGEAETEPLGDCSRHSSDVGVIVVSSSKYSIRKWLINNDLDDISLVLDHDLSIFHISPFKLLLLPPPCGNVQAQHSDSTVAPATMSYDCYIACQFDNISTPCSEAGSSETANGNNDSGSVSMFITTNERENFGTDAKSDRNGIDPLPCMLLCQLSGSSYGGTAVTDMQYIEHASGSAVAADLLAICYENGRILVSYSKR